jgi:phosphate transport system substrate-binding protein
VSVNRYRWSIAALTMLVGAWTFGAARAQELTAQGLPLSPMLRDAMAIQEVRAARPRIRIVGSSSMHDFTQIVASDVVAKIGLPEPMVESRGTREGIRTFCAGIGPDFPDIVAASRRITKSEYTACLDNGIADIIEVPIGLDAVALVIEKGEPVFNVTARHFYLALAAQVPRDYVLTANVSPEVAHEALELHGEHFIENPFKRWNEVDSRLPDLPIRVHGPGITSGTRDFINAALMEAGCRHFKHIRGIPSAAVRVRQCTTYREAPYFVEVAEPFEDKVIASVLGDEVGTLGIVTFDTYEHHMDRVDALPYNGLTISEALIASGEYPLRRTIYYYVKRAHMLNAQGEGVVRGLRDFMANLTAETVIGPDGLLDRKGLVPSSAMDREAARRNVGVLKRLER